MKKEIDPSSVQVSVRPARDAIARVCGTVHVEVTVTPPAARVDGARRPVALALVIDRSGSMAGPAAAAGPGIDAPASGADSGFADKLAFVKEASRRLLDLLVDGDLLSIVAFDDNVRVVKPMTTITARNRADLAAAIAAITAGGSTNIEMALHEGYGQFSDAIRKAHSCKLILLSDGDANSGETRPAVLGERAAGAAHNGVVTSSLGVGFDYNIALMANLAETGNGDFSHVENLDDLDRQLREELAGAAQVTAAGATVDISLPEGVAAGTNLNGYPQRSRDNGFQVTLGDLVRPKSFIFELTTPVKLETDTLEVAVLVEASDPDRGDLRAAGTATLRVLSQRQARAATVDAKLVERVLGMIRASAVADATADYDGGLADSASLGIRHGVATLDRAAEAYPGIAVNSTALAAGKEQLAQTLDDVEHRLLDAVHSKRVYMESMMQMQSRGPARDESEES